MKFIECNLHNKRQNGFLFRKKGKMVMCFYIYFIMFENVCGGRDWVVFLRETNVCGGGGVGKQMCVWWWGGAGAHT